MFAITVLIPLPLPSTCQKQKILMTSVYILDNHWTEWQWEYISEASPNLCYDPGHLVTIEGILDASVDIDVSHFDWFQVCEGLCLVRLILLCLGLCCTGKQFSKTFMHPFGHGCVFSRKANGNAWLDNSPENIAMTSVTNEINLKQECQMSHM